MFGDTPIIKNGSTTIITLKSFCTLSRLTNFLPRVNHHSTLVYRSTDDHGRSCLPHVSSKLAGRNPLFIMVLQEMKHVVVDAFQPLLNMRNIAGTSFTI